MVSLLSLKVLLILANSADPDEMRHTGAFHLGLHCLPKYRTHWGFPVFEGLRCTLLSMINGH